MARTADRPVAAGPHLAARRARLRLRARRAVVRGARRCTVNPLAAALVAVGLPRLRGASTRCWLKRRTWQNIVWGGAAGAVPPLVGWAAVDGRPRRHRDLPLRDRLLLDAAALLGAEPADEGRVRQGRRPDAAGRARRGRDAAPDPALHASCSTPSRSCRSAPAASAAIYLAASLLLGGALHRLAPCGCSAAPTGARALRLYLFSLAYLALLFARDGRRRPALIEDPDRHGPQPRPQERPHRPDRRRPSASSCSA